MIQLKNITKQFQADKKSIHALNQVNLKIEKGEIFGVIGYSGAGKSTLLRIINQLENQNSGQVFIDNVDISKLNEKKLRKQRQKIGMIFQHFNLLWSRNVEENIEFPLEIIGMSKIQRKKRVAELIRLVGLTGKEKSCPSELSGGQKQRVGIARALANEPHLLLCDEATSALDPETTESILDLLAKINKELKITMVVITHQMEVVQKICHRVAVMSEGNVVELGDVDSVFKDPQHEVSKKFIQTIHGEDVDVLQKQLKQYYSNGKLLRLVFSSQISAQPILSTILNEVDIEVNIVSANIAHTQKGAVGSMFVHLEKEKGQDQFIEKLQEKGVVVELW